MQGLQGTFPWSKKRLPSDKVQWCCVLECIILVHNFWTELVGHDQISAVFGPEYKRVINIHGYDRIRKYYLQPGNYETDDEAKLTEENFGNKGEDDDFFGE